MLLGECFTLLGCLRTGYLHDTPWSDSMLGRGDGPMTALVLVAWRLPAVATERRSLNVDHLEPQRTYPLRSVLHQLGDHRYRGPVLPGF